MIDDLNQAVVDRLKATMPAFKVDHFPEDIARYPFNSARHELLVSYGRSTYGAAKSFAPLHVDQEAEVAVTLLTSSLRGPLGVLETIRDVRRHLFGWRPARLEVAGDPPAPTWVLLGGSPLVPTGDRFVGEEQGVWRWSITFTTTFPVVEDRAALTGPLLKRSTAVRSEGGCQ